MLRNPGPMPAEDAGMHDLLQRPFFEEEDPPRQAPFADPWAPPEQEPVAPMGPADPTALMPWMDDLLGFGETSRTAAPELGGTRHAPPTRVADREAPNSDNRLPNQNWNSMTRATIGERWAPGAVQLPKEVVAGLADARKRTESDGKEHGGNVLRSGGIKSKTSMKYTGVGGTHHFEADPTQTDGKTFVGTYHSHPLKEGATDDAFSETDMSNMLDPGKRVSLMQSGDTTRMLARTKEFEAIMEAAESLDILGGEMDAAYNVVYEKALGGDPKKHLEAMEAATRAMAAKYHLLYYSGKGDLLQRVGGPKAANQKL